jgi:hypothetical protein
MILGCLLLSACDQRIGFRPLPPSIVEGHIEIRHDLGDPPSVIRGDFFEIGEDLILEFVIDHAENVDLSSLGLNWSVNTGTITGFESEKAYFTTSCDEYRETPLTVTLNLTWLRTTARGKTTEYIREQEFSRKETLRFVDRFNPKIVDGKIWYYYAFSHIFEASMQEEYNHRFPIGIGYFDPVTGGEYLFPSTDYWSWWSWPNTGKFPQTNKSQGIVLLDANDNPSLAMYDWGADGAWGTEDDLYAELPIPWPGWDWPEELSDLGVCDSENTETDPSHRMANYYNVSILESGIYHFPAFNRDADCSECSCTRWYARYWFDEEGIAQRKFLTDPLAAQVCPLLGRGDTGDCSYLLSVSDGLSFYQSSSLNQSLHHLVIRQLGEDGLPLTDDDKLFAKVYSVVDGDYQFNGRTMKAESSYIRNGNDLVCSTKTSLPQNDDCLDPAEACDAEIHFYTFDEQGNPDPDWESQPVIVPRGKAYRLNASGGWLSGIESLANSAESGILTPLRWVLKDIDEVKSSGWENASILTEIARSRIRNRFSFYSGEEQIDYTSRLAAYHTSHQECLSEDFNPYWEHSICDENCMEENQIEKNLFITYQYLLME